MLRNTPALTQLKCTSRHTVQELRHFCNSLWLRSMQNAVVWKYFVILLNKMPGSCEELGFALYSHLSWLSPGNSLLWDVYQLHTRFRHLTFLGSNTEVHEKQLCCLNRSVGWVSQCSMQKDPTCSRTVSKCPKYSSIISLCSFYKADTGKTLSSWVCTTRALCMHICRCAEVQMFWILYTSIGMPVDNNHNKCFTSHTLMYSLHTCN